MLLNPEHFRYEVNSYLEKSDEDKIRSYPKFLTSLTLDTFRHLRNLAMEFIHPVTVISGSNKTGKTTVLMAIACSHYNFERRDVANGEWKLATWSDLVRFTNHDQQNEDWEYHIGYREGDSLKNIRGYRRYQTKKWGGAGKKEGKIGNPAKSNRNNGRHVCLIDLNRINPGRHLTPSAFQKSRKATPESVSAEINEYLSYILELNYSVDKIAEATDNTIYKFSQDDKSYTTFNTASGEDVLVSLLTQILHEPDGSLILIDELEIGLHPKIQRTVMDVIYMISEKQHKQFIITSHSYAVIDSVPKESRIFLEDMGDGDVVSKSGLSTCESLNRMDSKFFQKTVVYVEDGLSEKIINKAVEELNSQNPGFASQLVVIPVGSAEDTYRYFKTRQRLCSKEPFPLKPSCVLDGDMQQKKDKDNSLSYPPEHDLFFHYSDDAPEKMLLRSYLRVHPNETLQYHADNSNAHCLFKKMVELKIAADENNAFDICFKEYIGNENGRAHFESLKDFLKNLE